MKEGAADGTPSSAVATAFMANVRRTTTTSKITSSDKQRNLKAVLRKSGKTGRRRKKTGSSVEGGQKLLQPRSAILNRRVRMPSS